MKTDNRTYFSLLPHPAKSACFLFRYCFLFLCAIPALQSTGQITSAQVRHSVESIPANEFPGRVAAIRQFYAALNYSPAWIAGQKRQSLLALLKNASLLGLKEEDYQYGFLASFREEINIPPGTAEDSINTDIKFTDAAIHFYGDLANGNNRPALGYYGLDYTPACRDVPALLAQYYMLDRLSLLTADIEPALPEIKPILTRIAIIEALLAAHSYREEKIVSAAVNNHNKPLLKKLYFLGISDSLDKRSDAGIKKDVKEAQLQFNLLSDGVLRSTALEELNISLTTRLSQLKLAVNYYRWLYCLSMQQPVVVVNIPAAYMKVYDPQGVRLEMKMVVGRSSTPTPTLSSTINEVILYPYWHVPSSIVFNELLPAIKRNPGYINENNFQVINMQGKVMNPYKINWRALSRAYFPYIIRQSTGCDNALGLIKLNFYNPFSVYLHDTPYKNLFTMNKRYFSHGCMRMEKPMDLGHLVLSRNPVAIDTLEEKGCVQNAAPVVVPADEKLPVIVWYNPAGIDRTGRVVFYEDVYGKFRQ